MDIRLITTNKGIEDNFYIRKEVFIKEQNVPLELEIDGLDKECELFVLYDNSTPIAACRIKFEKEYYKLQRVCVLKDYRKKGIGKKLILFVENYIKKNSKLNKIKLGAQVDAIKFYESLGYTICSEEYLDADILHKDMIKTMSN